MPTKQARYSAPDGAHLPYDNVIVSEADKQGTGPGVPASKTSQKIYEAGMPHHQMAPLKTYTNTHRDQNNQFPDPDVVSWLKSLKGIL